MLPDIVTKTGMWICG